MVAAIKTFGNIVFIYTRDTHSSVWLYIYWRRLYWLKGQNCWGLCSLFAWGQRTQSLF